MNGEHSEPWVNVPRPQRMKNLKCHWTSDSWYLLCPLGRCWNLMRLDHMLVTNGRTFIVFLSSVIEDHLLFLSSGETINLLFNLLATICIYIYCPQQILPKISKYITSQWYTPGLRSISWFGLVSKQAKIGRVSGPVYMYSMTITNLKSNFSSNQYLI